MRNQVVTLVAEAAKALGAAVGLLLDKQAAPKEEGPHVRPLFTRDDALTIARSLQVGLQAFVDELEADHDPLVGLSLLGTPPGEKTRNLIIAHVERMDRGDLEEAILEVDPKYSLAGKGMAKLRAKMVSIKLKELQVGQGDPGFEVRPATGVTFRPPGVLTNPESQPTAKSLLDYFAILGKDGPGKAKVGLYQQHMGCDMRCIRPGGCCPNVPICGALLDKEPFDGDHYKPKE